MAREPDSGRFRNGMKEPKAGTGQQHVKVVWRTPNGACGGVLGEGLRRCSMVVTITTTP